MLVTNCIGYLPDTTKAAPNMVIELKRDREMLKACIAFSALTSRN